MNARFSAMAFGALLFCISSAVRSGFAEIWLDPEPPLTWDATLSCELVILARYESHQASELKLKIVEVLKGTADTKQPLAVRLEHLYSLETGPVGWERFSGKPAKDDKTPKVCYKHKLTGGLEPYPVREDARQPAIYFFPRADRPALKIRGQVQSPQSQKGWQQALDGKPIDLPFRLMQDVNREMARDALEELGKSRDPAALDQLFSWIMNRGKDAPFNTFQVVPFLARLGDRDGDVYDRSAKSLFSVVLADNEYSHLKLGSLMAIVDPKRAMEDFPKWVAREQPLPVRQAALSGLGRIPRREAAQLALDCLRQGEVASFAVGAIHSHVYGDSGDLLPRNRGLENDQEWLVGELRAALVDKRVPDQVKKLIREQFWELVRERPPIELEVLRKILLDPKDPSYREHGKGDPPPKTGDEKTANMLRDVREACDPRLVPLLAEVLEKMPAASSNHGYAFQETLAHYARICPRAMRKELEKRDFPGKLPPPDPASGIPLGIRDTMEACKIWPSRHKPYLEKEVARCFALAAEVRAGKSEQTDALIREVDAVYVELEGRGRSPLPALLDSGSEVARTKFFDYLNKAKQGRLDRWSNQLSLREVVGVVSPLHPKHSKLHLELVLGLLKSKSLAEREAGVNCLSSWHSDFGFDHQAVEAERTRKLAEIEPLLHKLAAVSDTQAGVLLLARKGFVLEGEPNDAWLPTLQKAAGTSGEAAGHAMRLVEVVMGEDQCREFAYLPPSQRVRALKAYLADAGKIKESASK
ncbi:MAG: hypothetical protein K8R36_01365 [Planctomycetales bacterium]|nr:hypothetical protein [Planctomycetales bacterium]